MDVSKYVNITKEAGVATIWIDIKGEKMNIISPEFIAVFDQILPGINDDEEVKAIVLISAKKDFIAGADIKAFKGEKKGDFIPIIEAGHRGVFKIEKNKKPIVAAISGTCYGLGAEISLACAARVMSDEPNSKIALPEVKLGLLPGLGGTQRLPRLIGVSKALDMMLTGKNIFAKQALNMGLVDEVVNINKLHKAACSIALQLSNRTYKRNFESTLWSKILDDSYLGQSLVFYNARKSVQKLTRGNYPAPFEIINCVKYGLNNDIRIGLKYEAERFESLMLGDVSKELIALFFNMTENKKNPYPDAILPIKKMGIIGAGFMGEGIAEVTLNTGVSIGLKDLKEEVLSKSLQSIWNGLKSKVTKRIIRQTDAELSFSAVSTSTNNDAIAKADIVIEAVVEKMEVKKMVIADLEKQCKPNVIIASNTSSLSLTEMAKSAMRPQQIIGMHYFSPVQKMPLLEIVTTEFTSKETIATCYALGLKQGKTCIVVKDGPGFYVNRILSPYLNECLLMIEEGVPIEMIDEALMNYGFPVGPIKLLDEVGIDIVVHATNANRDYASQRVGYKPNSGLQKMFDAGYMGKKNKKGFYHYDEKTGKSKGLNKSVYTYFGAEGNRPIPVETICERAVFCMLKEARDCLREGIIQNEVDGNMGAIFGIGFMPFTGGPFKMIHKMGEDVFVSKMNQMKLQFGDRFSIQQ